ncbi:Hypothetical protein I595_2912 [Croceitalea dokdonensis DOKDO 023]|uniref:Uncharacterized protein n=1 Tax=Croceitalea dokdonensis DOKDO 023 TaxID=1300341 RepID=A0A0P7AX67_9FLAO|nr:Hypothetical protein I595_2912 [Croceitalea dokdonensis DOKDO 023]
MMRSKRSGFPFTYSKVTTTSDMVSPFHSQQHDPFLNASLHFKLL